MTIGVLILMSICALFFSAKWLAAEVYAKRVTDQITLWESYGDIYFLEEWEAALANINTAIALHHNKGEFHRLKGFIYEWRRVAPYPDNEDLNPMQSLRLTIQTQAEARQNALAAYRDSLSLRPAWAPVWIKVAYLKGMSGEFDDEFNEAVEHSYQFGRNLDFIQDNLTEISVRFFEEIQISEDLKKLQLTHLGKSLSNGRVHLDLINRFRLLPEVCQQLSNNNVQLNSAAERSCAQ
jgi:hypothetical protein